MHREFRGINREKSRFALETKDRVDALEQEFVALNEKITKKHVTVFSLSVPWRFTSTFLVNNCDSEYRQHLFSPSWSHIETHSTLLLGRP